MPKVSCPLRRLWIYISVSLTSLLLPDRVTQRLTRRLKSRRPIIFLTLLSSGNTVIGGGWEKGGHAFGDDKRLKKLIILVLIYSSYKEGFLGGHIAGCTFDLLLAHDKVVKWRCWERCRRLRTYMVPGRAFSPTVLPPLWDGISEFMTPTGSIGERLLGCKNPRTTPLRPRLCGSG